ncbi:MAG: tyrosine-protein phosphatase [Pararhizobium sp.]
MGNVSLRRVAGWSARIVGGAVLVCVLLLFAQYFSGNFHTVAAGRFYRSGQLSAAQIAHDVKKYGIRTIVNLRGENAGRPWYDAEVAEAKKLGVTHIDFRMSSRKQLAPDEVAKLLAIFRTAEKPILVHCEGGADRTGLASSLYVAAIGKGSEFDAELQLSPLYGHFGIPDVTRSYAMDETWERAEPSFGFSGS